MNSIEIYPGDGSVFKSEGAYFGNYFTYYSIREGSGEVSWQWDLSSRRFLVYNYFQIILNIYMGNLIFI